MDYFKDNEKMRAFEELVSSKKEAKKYFMENFDSNVELEAVRMERYGSSASIVPAVEPEELLKM